MLMIVTGMRLIALVLCVYSFSLESLMQRYSLLYFVMSFFEILNYVMKLNIGYSFLSTMFDADMSDGRGKSDRIVHELDFRLDVFIFFTI